MPKVDDPVGHELHAKFQLTEARWQAVLETARDAIVSIDESGRIALFNPAAEQIFGYAATEVLGKNVNVLMPSPYHEEHDDYLRRYLETGEAKAIGRIREVEAQRKSGEVFPIELSVSEARFGEEVVFSAIVRDVSEQRAANEQLRRRTARQAAISRLGRMAFRVPVSELMDEVVRAVAQQLDVEYVKILELMPEGKSLLLRAGVGWGDGLVGHCTVGTQLESQAGFTLISNEPVVVDDLRSEKRFRALGLLVDHSVLSGVSVTIDGSNGTFGVLGAHSTRRREFSEDDVNFLQSAANLVGELVESSLQRLALDESRESQRLILESAGEGICGIDTDGRTTFMNTAGAVMLGWEPGDLVGREQNEVLHHSRADGTRYASDECPIDRSFRDGEIHGGSNEVFWRKDGTSFPVTYSSTPILKNGEVVGAVVVFRDDTERLRLGRERDTARQLAAQRERLADVGALAAKIVHDIGNPVAGLSMSAQNVKRRLERDRTVTVETIGRPIERIISTAARLDGLVTEFKHFLQEQRLQMDDVCVAELFNDTLSCWDDEARARGIELTVVVPGDLAPIRADAGKLRRVLDNLVKNAIDAVDHGPGAVKLLAGVPDSETLNIIVEDSGPGVPDGVDIFALFETTKSDGSGLGLPIAKQIVEAHGGGIEFAIVEPHGTRFTVRLPRQG